MGKLNREQLRDYIRSIVGEFDSKRINESTLNEDINLEQRDLQMNTLEVGGIKQYTKVAYNEGQASLVPTDMLFHPNAIIDIEASTGTRSTANVATGNSGFIRFTLAEPNTEEWGISWVAGATAISISVNPVNLAVTVNYPTGTTTALALINALNANPTFLLYFIACTGTTTSAIVTLTGSSSALTAGTGTGWKYVEEKSIQEFNRIKGRSFVGGSVAEPVYRRLGNSSGSQVIEFAPNSISYSKIYYHYLLADLTVDTDVSGLPLELEGLLLIGLQRRVYIYLKQQKNSDDQNAEYQKKLQDLNGKYQAGLAFATQDSKRIEQLDT